MLNQKKGICLENEALFFEIVQEILKEPRYRKTKQFIQHGGTSVYRHSLAVAYFSCYLAEILHLRVRKRELVRGALLHDYFLYDWHEKSSDHRLHGFTHPARALRNAAEDYKLTPVEMDIIQKHMFPLTVVPPMHRESYLVCLADKICSTYETFHRKRMNWPLYHLNFSYYSLRDR